LPKKCRRCDRNRFHFGTSSVGPLNGSTGRDMLTYSNWRTWS